ncbi:histone-lysine N-methyltransferase EZA1-like isoform X2 [Gastrolobium bilobum]|uniref:histone-lysine N-methyltransferase EZA1-like isoform X2 n=1 Tax=Gastrolobium bilobum TaxID=150636 RepID=UPI002AB1A486|nr:histone-lysine N-methyltransferase EZA1-like isoform X2 [Gastrolobium bilobum]
MNSNSKTTGSSSSDLQRQHGEAEIDADGTLLLKLNKLLMQIQGKRMKSIRLILVMIPQERIKSNGKIVKHHVSIVLSAISRKAPLQTEENTNQMLSSRIDRPLCKFSGFSQGSGDKDHVNSRNILSETSIKIPYIERLPPYTFWIHLARNQRMAEDQSVVGRRRIYYDQHGSEALVCSDSDEELSVPKEVKHNFSEGEDRLLWMAFEEHGLTEEVLNIVRQFVGGTSSEIQERYKNLKEKNMRKWDQHSEDSGRCDSHIGICLEKSLSATLDSFDNLFCRRCIIFDCPLHGCSQPLIYPSEKQLVWSEPEDDRKPCSDQCYLQLKDVNILSEDSTLGSYQDNKIKTMEQEAGILAPFSSKEPGNQSTKAILQEERCNYVTATPFTTEVGCRGDLNSNVPVSESMGKRKVTNLSESALCDSTRPPDDSQGSCKKLKRISDDIVRDLNLDALGEEKHPSTCASLKSFVEHTSNKLIVSSNTCHGEHDKGVEDGQKDVTNEREFKQLSDSIEGQVDEMACLSEWKPLEKDLYSKGVEMFGRNSCLIARNLLFGLKTCMQVANYMYAGGVSMRCRSLPSSIMDKNGKIHAEFTDQGMPSRSRFLRKRSKTRKFKYSRKSAGLPSMWRRIAHGKNQFYKQYTPCGCQGMCGKQCPCVHNETCCEKYCGCSKSCKNRFRGCHCAKSQCRSRQCPCFAAGRECDPDVCRNCWVSCGDGSLGEPPRRGDGQCGNMRLLLRQQQRILLAKSDVAGWGAFLKNPVNKNDYLGEYTGEMISHREAEKRGKIYDRANFSFLFDLNDQYVLDAYRKGDKLKFANHSSKPNCYAKVLLVAGDHRVGIFANEHIEAGEELFYDYRYGPNHTPPWVLKLKSEGPKRDESAVSQGRAKKHQSH